MYCIFFFYKKWCSEQYHILFLRCPSAIHVKICHIITLCTDVTTEPIQTKLTIMLTTTTTKATTITTTTNGFHGKQSEAVGVGCEPAQCLDEGSGYYGMWDCTPGWAVSTGMCWSRHSGGLMVLGGFHRSGTDAVMTPYDGQRELDSRINQCLGRT